MQEWINLELCLEKTGSDQHFTKHILGLFMQELMQASEEIPKIQNTQKFKDLIHKLQGGLAYLALPRLKNILFELESELPHANEQKKQNLINKLTHTIKKTHQVYTLFVEETVFY